MTVYEQIQIAIELIEIKLSHILMEKEIAKEINMSLRSFQHYFVYLTGYRFREYLLKRRLTKSLFMLDLSSRRILDIAISVGYTSHEAFTRAFKKEFGITPLQFREENHNPAGLEKINLIKGIHMGVLKRSIEDFRAKSFTAFSPHSEEKAMKKLENWLNQNNLKKTECRIFGHNIDNDGALSHEPDNPGYRFLVAPQNQSEQFSELTLIPGGLFAVTGIEGNFRDDPAGRWISRGWKRMTRMLKEEGYPVKQNARWFEEHLEPETEGNLRLDLYLEINDL